MCGATYQLQSLYTLLSCVTMALNRYFQASEKSGCKLPDPRGPLSRLVTFVVDCVCQRESAECAGKQAPHSEWAKGTTLRQALSPELKAEIGRRAIEHGVAATVRLYAIVGRWVWLT